MRRFVPLASQALLDIDLHTADLERRSTQLQTAAEVSRAASSILAPDELIQQVVDLVCERFDLYYAGLFLVDQTGEWTGQPGKWAVLRAGSGEAGRKMLEAGHKLEIGGTSMIGWCVANKQARIALDVGEEAVRFDNPFLPETRSELALPLVSRGQVIGAMTVQSAQAAAFSEEDIAVLQTMADQLAIAIENARLFEDTKSRLAQLTALQETTGAVASTLELDKLLSLITQQAATLLQSDGGIINLVDWENREDEVVAAIGSQAHTLGFRSLLEGSLSGWVTLHNQPVISNQLQKDNRVDRRWRSGEVQGQNAAIAPLTIKDQVMGTLVVMDKQGGKGEFDQADLDLLIAFANQAATAIENARLFEETRRRAEEQQGLTRIAALAASTLELDELLERVMEETARMLNSQSGVLLLLDEERGELVTRYVLSSHATEELKKAWRIPLDTPGFEKSIFARGGSYFCNDVEGDLAIIPTYRPHIRALKVHNFAGVALRSKGRSIGELYVGERPGDFGPEDTRLLRTIAGYVTSAIENARLLEQAQQEITERKQAEEALQQREAVLGAIALAAEKLLRPGDWEQDIQAVLAYLGKAADVSRAIIWVASTSDDGEYLISGRYEWIAPEAKLAPQLGLQNVPVFRRWRDLLPRGEIITGHVRDFSANEQEFFVPRGIKSVLVVPIFVNNAWWGFMGFDQGGTEREWAEAEIDVLKTAASILGGALERKRTEEALERRTTQLQTAAEVSRAASSILDLSELIQRVADLVRERFDLYYAGLFLVDQTGEWTGEPGKWAVLRAGTGEAGRKMLEAGHKLEIGDTSMIGWCVANKQARIALDVTSASSVEPGEEAVRFDHPLLPETRSELALPLFSRGQVIGAMTIQSTQEAAFSGEDIAVLQAMADQLANAIENARLFEQTQHTRFLLGERVRELYCLNDIGRKMDETPPIPELLQWIAARIRAAMQYPDLCLAAIQFEGQVYGATEAVSLPCQMVQALRIGGEVVGRVYISYIEERDFTDEESAMLGDIVRRVSDYIESRHLFEETQAHAEEMAVLNELSQALTARLSVKEVLDEVHRGASRLLDATNFYVALYDPDRDEVTFPLDVTEIEDDKFHTLPAEQGLTGHIIRNRTSVLIEENVPGRLAEMGVELVGETALSWLGVPMMVGDQVLGVMGVQSFTTPRAYDEHDRDLLTALAGQTAIALQNARLFEETQRRAEELAALNELGRALTARLSVEEVLEETYRQASRLVDTTNFYIGLYDPERHEITFSFEVSESEIDRRITVMSADEGLTGYIVRNRTSLLFEENVAEQEKELGIEGPGEEAQSWLGVPLMIGDQVLGVMAVQSHTTPRLYDEHDQALLTAIASQAAVALESAHLFEQIQTRAEREHVIREISDQMQRATDMETLMRITAEELSRALGSSRAYVRLGVEAQRSLTDDGADG